MAAFVTKKSNLVVKNFNLLAAHPIRKTIHKRLIFFEDQPRY